MSFFLVYLASPGAPLIPDVKLFELSVKKSPFVG